MPIVKFRHVILSSVLTALACSTGTALADPFKHRRDDDSHRDQARVISSYPLFEQVAVPRRVCRHVTVPVHPHSAEASPDLGGAVIGGIAGGLIGSHLGRGDGRVASAAVGALAGTLIGQNLSSRPHGHGHGLEREVSRCHTVEEWENRITGYQVTYEYGGRFYTTRVPHDPGPFLNVRISVQPVWGGPPRH